MSRLQLHCPNCRNDDHEQVEMAYFTIDGVALHKCAECALIHIDKDNVARILAKHGVPGLDALGGGDGGDHIADCAHCESDNLKRVVGGKEGELQAFDLCEDCQGIQFEPQWDRSEAATDLRDIGVMLKALSGK